MRAVSLRHESANREWFVDPRATDRRLQVKGHPDARCVVLSMWHGDTCTATFQLPINDAPRLIAHIADCLTVGIQAPSRHLGVQQPPVSLAQRARAAMQRLQLHRR